MVSSEQQTFAMPKRKRGLIRRTRGEVVFDTVNVLFLLGVAFATLYPFYYIFIVSISSGIAVLNRQVSFFPRDVTLIAYELLMDYPLLWSSYRNTLLYVSVGTAINLGVTALCAYPLSKKRFVFRRTFMFLIVLTMFFQGGMIPLYMVVRRLGILNSIWAITLPTAVHTFYMIIMRTFFQGIPEDLTESAYIDGANDIFVFIRIILPLSTPILATLTLFYAVNHWNSFLPALIYLRSASKYPLQIFLRNMVVDGSMGELANEMGGGSDFFAIDTTVKYAAIIYTTAPILILYPFLQKYFVKGMMIGSLKG